MPPIPAPALERSPARSPYRFFVEAVLFLGYFLFGLSWISYAPFLHDFQVEYSLTHAQVSLLISTVSFAKIFMPFAAGWLATQLGLRRSVSLGLVFMSFSLWTPFTHFYSEALLSRFVFGLGGAIIVTLIGPMVLQWFPRTELPVVNGINYVAVNTGISASLFLTLPLVAQLGKRNTLVTYALASLAIAAAWLLWGKDRPRENNTVAPAEGYGAVLRKRETWFLALSFTGPLALYLVLNTWLPTFYAESMGMTRQESARLTGLFNLAGIPAAVAGGFITRLWGRRKPLIWIPGVLMSVSAFGLFLLRQPAQILVCAAIFGAALFLWISPVATLAMELPGMTPQRLGMVNGVFYSVSYVGAFFAPLIVGALRDRTGSFVPGFTIFALASWSLVVFSLLLPETGKRASVPSQ